MSNDFDNGAWRVQVRFRRLGPQAIEFGPPARLRLSQEASVERVRFQRRNGVIMNKRNLNRYSLLCCGLLMLASAVQAKQHVWAGRNLSDFEWAIHERLASLPMREAFETIEFEVRGQDVILTGRVLHDRLRQAAKGAVARVEGVGKVVDKIEVLPTSRRDDLLRLNVYRAIYQPEAPEGSIGNDAPRIHIIVQHGWVALEGTVNSRSARDAAHLAALKVTPHVLDHLRVVPENGARGDL